VGGPAATESKSTIKRKGQESIQRKNNNNNSNSERQQQKNGNSRRSQQRERPNGVKAKERDAIETGKRGSVIARMK